VRQVFATSKSPLFEFGDDIDFPKLDKKFTAFVASRFHEEAEVQLDTDQLHSAFEALGWKSGSLIALARTMLRAGNYNLTVALAGAPAAISTGAPSGASSPRLIAVNTISAAPGKAYVGHTLDVTEEAVVQ
jgi:hypothetical protein